MLYVIMAVIIGLGLLVWGTDRFIDGSAATARHFGMSPLLIGMVIVGFGTSAPEIVVSVMSALDGSSRRSDTCIRLFANVLIKP